MLFIVYLKDKMRPGNYSFKGHLDPLIVVTDCQKDNLIFFIIVFIPKKNLYIMNKIILILNQIVTRRVWYGLQSYK